MIAAMDANLRAVTVSPCPLAACPCSTDFAQQLLEIDEDANHKSSLDGASAVTMAIKAKSLPITKSVLLCVIRAHFRRPPHKHTPATAAESSFRLGVT
jgi:hypothetical protein